MRTFGLLVLLLLGLLVTACALRIDRSNQQPPVAPATEGYPPVPEGVTDAEVVRVIDGDTLVVTIRGREERVRLIGINTPESVDPRRPVECFGIEASDNAKALLEGRRVYLEDDPSQDSRDSNGRLLRYVWLEDGRMVNLEQIAQGFASEYTFAQPYKYRDIFRRVQREAQAAERGLWSAATCDGQFAPLGAAPNPATPPTGQGRIAQCPRDVDRSTAPESPVRIVALDKSDEVVTLQNLSAESVNLDGWILCSQRGQESQPAIGGVLAPGERRAFRNPGQAIWSNSNRDNAALFDAAGRLVSYWEDEA